MLFKGRATLENGNFSEMQLGVAYAPTPDSPMKVLNGKNPVFKLDGQGRGEAEDPFLWYEDGCFYAVFKDQRGEYTGERGAGVMAYSKEVRWEDGTQSNQGNLERPFIFFDEGKPVCIFFATMNGKGGFSGKRAWNMVIPISQK